MRIVLSLLIFMLPVIAQANTYLQRCSFCHGAEGVATMPGVPNLAETKLNADQIMGIIENGRGKMPKINIDDTQKSEVVQYIIENIKK